MNLAPSRRSAAGRRRLRSAWLPLLLWIAPAVFLATFYFYPLARIFALSFGRAETSAGPWLELLSPSMLEVVGFTFYQALLSTLLTLLLGLPGAYLLARYEFPGRSLFRALTAVPFIMPTLVVAAAFNSLLGPQGWLNQALMALFDLPQPPITFVNTLTAILLAHVFYNTTIVLRLVGDFWARLDPRLGLAGRVLGANPWQVLWKITLPLLAPAILSAALLVFIFNFTSFGVILVLGGPQYSTIETEIYYQTTGLFNLPLAAALSLVQLLCTLALTVVYAPVEPRVALAGPADRNPHPAAAAHLAAAAGCRGIDRRVERAAPAAAVLAGGAFVHPPGARPAAGHGRARLHPGVLPGARREPAPVAVRSLAADGGVDLAGLRGRDGRAGAGAGHPGRLGAGAATRGEAGSPAG